MEEVGRGDAMVVAEIIMALKYCVTILFFFYLESGIFDTESDVTQKYFS